MTHYPARGKDVSPQQRIKERVAVMPDGCWLWLYSTVDGYGKLGVIEAGREIYKLAHRYSYEAFRGPIPQGLELDHVVCDEPLCCNPWHVEPRTMWENVSRAPEFNLNKTHCKSGHPFDYDNTYLYPSGRRGCRECRRISVRKSYWRKRGEKALG